jgi:CBS-domain-containing membrane protein
VSNEVKRTFRSIHPTKGAWPRGLIDGIWAPIVSGGLILLVGGLGLLAGDRIWLFASLGPTAYLLAEDPEEPSSRPYNAFVSHLIAELAGYAAVFALGIAYEPSVFSLGYLTPPRVWASVVAIVLAEAAMLAADAAHPPAASTALLVALGSFRPTIASATLIPAGAGIVVAVGEIFRRLRRGGNLRGEKFK